jgi:hypothetical protein
MKESLGEETPAEVIYHESHVEARILVMGVGVVGMERWLGYEIVSQGTIRDSLRHRKEQIRDVLLWKENFSIQSAEMGNSPGYGTSR